MVIPDRCSVFKFWPFLKLQHEAQSQFIGPWSRGARIVCQECIDVPRECWELLHQADLCGRSSYQWGWTDPLTLTLSGKLVFRGRNSQCTRHLSCCIAATRRLRSLGKQNTSIARTDHFFFSIAVLHDEIRYDVATILCAKVRVFLWDCETAVRRFSWCNFVSRFLWWYTLVSTLSLEQGLQDIGAYFEQNAIPRGS